MESAECRMVDGTHFLDVARLDAWVSRDQNELIEYARLLQLCDRVEDAVLQRQEL
jgi:hypothetical protein